MDPVSGALALVGSVALIGGVSYQQLGRHSAYAESLRETDPDAWLREMENRRLAADADAQHAAWMNGDPAGLYGRFPPVAIG